MAVRMRRQIRSQRAVVTVAQLRGGGRSTGVHQSVGCGCTGSLLAGTPDSCFVDDADRIILIYTGLDPGGLFLESFGGSGCGLQ